MFIALNILIILIILFFIFYKKIQLENYIFENIIFMYIFSEYGLFFIILYFIIYFFYFCLSRAINLVISSFFLIIILFKANGDYKEKEKLSEWEIELQKEKQEEEELEKLEKIKEEKAFKKNRISKKKANGDYKEKEKLTEWEIEFQKEKQEEEELEKLEKIKEEKAFKKNRNERRKRRKIRYETVEYPGDKYHPDYDGVYFFYERFQDGVWRTEGVRKFRSKFKVYFPFVLFFIFIFLVWLVDCLSSVDFFIYNTNSVYVKIDNQFVCLNRKLFSKKGINFLTVFDWNDQSVNRFKILRNGKFRKYEKFFITDLNYNWMLQKDIRSKKFPFKFYNWIFYRNDIMIVCENYLKHEKIPKKPIFTDNYSYRLWRIYRAHKYGSDNLNKYIKVCLRARKSNEDLPWVRIKIFRKRSNGTVIIINGKKIVFNVKPKK